MVTTPEVVSLRDFGAMLEQHGENLKVSQVKQLPFSCLHPVTLEPVVLGAFDTKELSQILAFALGMSLLNKRKNEIDAFVKGFPGIKEMYPKKDAKGEKDESPARLQAEDRVRAFEGRWLVQSLNRSAGGDLVKDPETKMPSAVLDAVKLGQLLKAGRVSELFLDADFSDFAVIEKSLPTRATHVAKLSFDPGNGRSNVSGGFLKQAPTALGQLFDGAISEEDYLTPNNTTLACNAGYQAGAWLAFTAVKYGDFKGRLVDLLREDASLRAQLQTELESLKRGLNLAPLFEVIASFKNGGFTCNTQLFCATDKETLVVTPLIPYALPEELLRAKAALANSFSEAQKAESVRILSLIEPEQEALAVLKSVGAKNYPEGALAHKAAVSAAKEKVAELKKAAKAAEKTVLAIPSFAIPLGGSTPRNIASGLTTALHTAPIFTKIKAPPKRALVGNKVHYPASLLETPKIQAQELPPELKSTANNARDRNARAHLFSALALEALSPLIELREAWDKGELDSPEALHSNALQALAQRSDSKSLFVKGSDLTGTASRAAFKDLVDEVSLRVKDAMRNAFKTASFVAFDEELHKAVNTVVQMECA